jgi:arylsulfatase
MQQDRAVTNFPPGFFLTDAIAKEASAYIRKFNKSGEPFFVYAAFTAPHWPLHAPKEDFEKYIATYRRGWDELRRERFERQVAGGIVAPGNLPPRDPEARSWSSVTNKDWQAQRMAVYAAQIERMDRGIGEMVRTLEETGERENTVIMFLSDNGGCAENLGPNQKALHVPQKAPDGGAMRLGNSPEIFPGGPDTYASYGLPWANLSNTPFRSYKHWVHEGGIATPFIVSWPAKITRGALRHTPSYLPDVMATCLELAGAKYPRAFAGNQIVPMQGQNLEPVFRGKKLKERPLFFEHEGNRAVRLGDWKLVSRHPGEWELYNITKDRSEQIDLASVEQKKVKELSQLYEEWSARVGVPAAELVATTPRRTPPAPEKR